jgi:MFS family permease
MMKVVPAAQLQKASAIGHIAEGFRFVAHAAPIRVLLLLLGLVSLTGMPYAVLMPVFADHIFHSGARGLGILMGFSGVGALIGALALATRQGIRGLGRWVAVSTGAFGASLILFSFSRQLWIGAALLIPVGLSMMIQMGASNTLIQTMTPDHLRGRVMAVYSMMFMGMAPIGALLSGVLADRLGAPFTVAIGGVIAIAGSFAFGLRLPALRPEARRLIMAQHMVAGDPADEVTAHGGGDPDLVNQSIEE